MVTDQGLIEGQAHDRVEAAGINRRAVGVTVAIIKRFRCAARADGGLRLENPGQVLVNQQTVLNEDIAFKNTQ